jgi:hypothetical protein
VSQAWATAGIAAAAAIWFWLGMHLPLNLTDEGQIVYASWLVSEGALPYRDFQHLYGPALFWWNGAAMAIAGADLAVVRGLLVLVKASSVALTFALARRVAPLAVAATAAGLLTAIWGMPWFYSTVPYANYNGMALGSLGVLLVLGAPRPGWRRCAAAGLCFGLAALFKQTTGLFPLLAVLVGVIGARDPGPAPARLAPLAPLLRWSALVAAFALPVFYLSSSGGVTSLAWLGAPWIGAVAKIALRERRETVPEAAASAPRIVALSTGALVPLLAAALFYASQGQLDALVKNTVTELPAAVSWYTPFELPRAPGLLWCALYTAAAVSIRSARLRPFALAAAGIVALALGIGARGNAQEWEWLWGVLASLGFAPILLAWGLVTRPPGPPGRDTLILGLFALTGLFYLHPAADLWHALGALPVFLPAACMVLRGERGGVSLATGLALLAAMALPFIPALPNVRSNARRIEVSFEHASDLRLLRSEHASTVAVIKLLQRAPYAEREMLASSGQQLLYFLADRQSPVDDAEFALYMIGLGLIQPEDAQRLVDQASVIARLEDARPLIVEDRRNATQARLREALPKLARWLDANYEPIERVGHFRVLDRRDRRTPSRPPSARPPTT